MPKASVIMPCFNHGHFVKHSVDSILMQSMRDFELIVVDDNSTDNSVAVLQELSLGDPRLKLIVHDKNRGASRSRNDALRLATGDFVGFCDADDLWKPEKLETQIKLLMLNPSYDVTYCDSEIIDQTGKLTGELFSSQFPPPCHPSGDLFEDLCTVNFINMQTVLLRRHSIGNQIYFDERIKWVEDWWQWIRLSRDHQFLYEKRPMAQYRVHPQSTGFTQKHGIHRNRWKVYKNNLRTHTGLAVSLQALLWYKMGLELSILKRPHMATKFLCHAFCVGLKGRSSFRCLLTMSVRAGLEYWRGLKLN